MQPSINSIFISGKDYSSKNNIYYVHFSSVRVRVYTNVGEHKWFIRLFIPRNVDENKLKYVT